jgi:neuropeptide FF receptor 2
LFISIQMCTEVWPNESASQTYFLAVNLGLQYLIPLSIIVFFYLLLFIKIWRRKMPRIMRQHSDDTLNNWNTRIVEKSKIKVLKMLIAIVSLFALSWLPLYAIFARIKLGPAFDENSFEGISCDQSMQ